MHFRTRNNIVQIVRTTYDPGTKKPRTEIVGRLDRAAPEIDDALRAACSTAEVEEVQRWIGSRMRADSVAAEHAARTLPEQMVRARQWFASSTDDESTRPLAEEIQQSWAGLRNLMRRKSLIE